MQSDDTASRGDEVDFETLHRITLPPLLRAGRSDLVVRALPRGGSLALRLPDGTAYTYRIANGSLDLIPGDADAETVLAIDADTWAGLVREEEAAAGLIYARRIRCLRGKAVDLMTWESALRALYNGRAPYDPAAVDWLDRRGNALEPNQIFAADCEPLDLSHFLIRAGYLFVRGVFRSDEAAAFLQEADQLAAEARKGDKLSWWGRNAAGEELLCRVTRANAKPRLASLINDPRMLALRDLAPGRLVHKRGEGQGVTVIYKRPAMSEGLSDLPWHRDCGMGGHALNCPALEISVYLSEATAETGELMMLPGSQNAAVNAHDAHVDFGAHAAHFRAQPGDASLHFSDTVHAAPPPTTCDRERYRVSAILSFARPQARHHRGEGSYNDVLHQREDGQIEHLTAAAKRL